MPTAKKYNTNRRSMSIQSRGKCYAIINILWTQMRPDLRLESKVDIRDARLEWIADFLGLKNLSSTTKLTDLQIGRVVDEMKRLTGQADEKTAPVIKSKRDNVISADFTSKVKPQKLPKTSETIHLASEEQQFTLEKLAEYIYGEDTARLNNFLTTRHLPTNFRTLTFAKATGLTIILLNIAAQKDLKAQGFKKITRAMTAKYIPTLKIKLRIKK